MLRLIERGLMFGGLVEIATPVLVDRYNQALEKLTNQRTALSSFHIDSSGFAPEIGEELGNERYLNPEGCNRQFILLTLDQIRAPLLNAHFSSSRHILKTLFRENSDTLFALTSRDAVVGELLNSINQVTSIDQLHGLRYITVEAETPGKHIANGKALLNDIEEFKTTEDGWYDDALVERLINGATEVGDILRRPLELKTGPYEVGGFYTVHCDGLYLFKSDDQAVAIGSSSAIEALKDSKLPAIISLGQKQRVADFLAVNDYVETIFDAVLDHVALLKQRIEFVLAHHFAHNDAKWRFDGKADLRANVYRNLDALPALFHALSDRLHRAEQRSGQAAPDVGDRDYFYLWRARRGPHRDLTNMLLSALAPLDARQLFICHKAAFYDAYAGWPDAFRAYVADVLARDYIPNKAVARTRLFGDADAPEPQPSMGPWGPRGGIVNGLTFQTPRECEQEKVSR
jgi:hypothetical protein